MNINKIYNEDCLDTMARMPNNFIDLTVTSPPYDNLRAYDKKSGFKWNFEIFKLIARELYRVTKDGGVVVWVVGDATVKGSETGSSFRQALYFKDECGFNLHDTMIYEKETPTWNITSKRYRQHIEYMFVLTKKKVNIFNPIEDKKVKNKNPRACKSNRNGIPYYEMYTPKKDYTCRSNIWKYAVGGKKTVHPAPFPEQLAEDHIISWSNEESLVYDPMAGSGTTLKMAKKNNRNYIGSEISEEYCKITQERLKEAEWNLRM